MITNTTLVINVRATTFFETGYLKPEPYNSQLLVLFGKRYDVTSSCTATTEIGWVRLGGWCNTAAQKGLSVCQAALRDKQSWAKHTLYPGKTEQRPCTLPYRSLCRASGCSHWNDITSMTQPLAPAPRRYFLVGFFHWVPWFGTHPEWVQYRF